MSSERRSWRRSKPRPFDALVEPDRVDGVGDAALEVALETDVDVDVGIASDEG